jgi:transcriptional regulator with XRE-family HTH domain
MDGLIELGEQIRSARRGAHLTQNALCARAGVSRDTLSRLERGETVDTSTLIKIASALDLRIDVSKRQLRGADMRRKYAHLHEEGE